ncbi:MAG: efflux transporter outer membrane subunit [Pseudomonadota bacterium]
MIKPSSARPRRAAFLIALFASGCASVPHMAPPAVSRATELQAQAHRLNGEATAWPADGWWTGYGDQQLDRLMADALAQSPDLAAATARIRVADGYARQAGAALLPSITASGNVSGALLSKNNGVPAQIVPGGWNDTGSVGIGGTIDIDLWGKNRANLRAAKLEAAATRYEAEQAKLALTTAIASAYAELAALHAQRDSLESALAIRTQTLALVDQRVAQGLDTEAVQRQARARLEATQASLAATDEAIGLARNAIAALIGSGPDRALDISRPNLATLTVQPLPAKAGIDLIGRRPDIAAARARAEAAQQRVKAARAEFYPNLSLSALVGTQAFGLGNLFASNSTFGAAGPAVSLPLFRGGALQGQYRARRGQYDEAIAFYDRTVIGALHETADAMTSRTLLVTRLEASRRALADFEAANRLARLRYSQGLSTYLDVLTAEEGVLDSRLTVARLQTRAFALDVALVRALGGGFHA